MNKQNYTTTPSISNFAAPAQLPIPAQADLDSLAALINAAHADAQNHAFKAVERALVSGEVAK